VKIQIGAILLLMVGSLFGQGIAQMPVEKLQELCDSLLAERNHTVAIQYTRLATKEGLYIPLEMYNTSTISLYCTKVPELQKLQDDLGFVEIDMNKILMTNTQYNSLISNYERLTPSRRAATRYSFENQKERLIQTMLDSSPEFVRLHTIHLKIRSAINRKALGYIADDYQKRNEIFPLDWIPDETLKQLLRKSNVRKLDRQIGDVQNYLTQKLSKQ
jgi:hypothetical protein